MHPKKIKKILLHYLFVFPVMLWKTLVYTVSYTGKVDGKSGCWWTLGLGIPRHHPGPGPGVMAGMFSDGWILKRRFVAGAFLPWVMAGMLMLSGVDGLWQNEF
jgi:hypothetical protein